MVFFSAPTPYSACILEQRSGNIHLPILSLPYVQPQESTTISPYLPRDSKIRDKKDTHDTESKKGIDERDKKKRKENPENRELVFADFPAQKILSGQVFHRSCSLLIGKSKGKIISPGVFIFLPIFLFSGILSGEERLDFWCNLGQLSCGHLRLKAVGGEGFPDTSNHACPKGHDTTKTELLLTVLRQISAEAFQRELNPLVLVN